MSATRPGGFGTSGAFGEHVLRVRIEAGRTAPVTIVEDYGYQGGDGGVPDVEVRAVLPRRVWSAIADTARREFNGRLRGLRVPAGRWRVGDNPVDRMLGKELCVLAWAAETAALAQVPVVCSRWEALRPEERWWLFAVTAAEAGLAEDKDRGWRRALAAALSDGKQPAPQHRTRRPVEVLRVLKPGGHLAAFAGKQLELPLDGGGAS